MYKAYRKFSVRNLGLDPSDKDGDAALLEETNEPVR
jgi:hypothetical protein